MRHKCKYNLTTSRGDSRPRRAVPHAVPCPVWGTPEWPATSSCGTGAQKAAAGACREQRQEKRVEKKQKEKKNGRKNAQERENGNAEKIKYD